MPQNIQLPWWMQFFFAVLVVALVSLCLPNEASAGHGKRFTITTPQAEPNQQKVDLQQYPIPQPTRFTVVSMPSTTPNTTPSVAPSISPKLIKIAQVAPAVVQVAPAVAPHITSPAAPTCIDGQCFLAPRTPATPAGPNATYLCPSNCSNGQCSNGQCFPTQRQPAAKGAAKVVAAGVSACGQQVTSGKRFGSRAKRLFSWRPFQGTGLFGLRGKRG